MTSTTIVQEVSPFFLFFLSEFSVSVSFSSLLYRLSAISFGRKAAIWTLKG